MANTAINISDVYMSSLNALSDSEKIDLATKLLNSLKGTISSFVKSEDPFAGLNGSWEDGRSVEEVEEDIRANRLFTRDNVEW